MSGSSTALPQSLAVTLILASASGGVVWILAWRAGGRSRQASGPVGLLASLAPLIAEPPEALLPYTVFWALGIGAVIAVWSGLVAWRAGGRWREFALPLAAIGMALPLSLWGYAYGGPSGILELVVVAWFISMPWLWLVSMLLMSKGFTNPGGAVHVRASAWGATAIFGPAVMLGLYSGKWLVVAEGLAALLYAWAIDYLTRTHRWARIDSWIEAKAVRIIVTVGTLGIAYPLSLALILREDRGLHAVRIAMTRAFDFGHVAPSEIVFFLVATSFASLALDPLLPRITKVRAWGWASAYLPLAIWVMAVRLVPPDFATCGVLFSLLLTATTIGAMVIGRPARAS